MSALARVAGPLALFGGTVWVVATLALAVIPSSYAWLGLIVAMTLIGGAALGLQQQVGARTGSLGRWAAVATAAGPLATLALLLIALATTGGNMATPPPTVVLVLSLVAFVLWLGGSIAFALSLIRAKAISSIAGWLIVLGAAFGTVALFASGESPSPLVFVPLGMYGIGWILQGLAGRTPTAVELNAGGQAS